MFCFVFQDRWNTIPWETSHLPLPKELKAKQGFLNIQNNDKRCFLWSIQASLHPEQHGNHLTRVLKYQEYQHELNMSGIRYVVDIKDIGKFEHQNNVSVNVYEYEDKNIFPLRMTNVTVARPQLNFCQYCLHGCSSEEVLKTHMERCKLHGVQRIKLPEAGNKKGREKVKFTKT